MTGNACKCEGTGQGVQKLFDVSVRNITEADTAKLLAGETPCRLMVHDQGCFVYGGVLGSLMAGDLREWGLSEQFIVAWQMAQELGCEFLNFTTNADEVPVPAADMLFNVIVAGKGGDLPMLKLYSIPLIGDELTAEDDVWRKATALAQQDGFEGDLALFDENEYLDDIKRIEVQLLKLKPRNRWR